MLAQAPPEAEDAEPDTADDAPTTATPSDATDPLKQAADQHPEADAAKDDVTAVPAPDPNAAADTDAAEQSPSKTAASATASKADADGASKEDVNPTDGATAAVVDVAESVAAQRSASPVAAPADRQREATKSAAAANRGKSPPGESPDESDAQPAALLKSHAGPAASDGDGPAAEMDAEASMAANDTGGDLPIGGAESQEALKAEPGGTEEGKVSPPASVPVEAVPGPEAMEEDDGAPEVDFEVDVVRCFLYPCLSSRIRVTNLCRNEVLQKRPSASSELCKGCYSRAAAAIDWFRIAFTF